MFVQPSPSKYKYNLDSDNESSRQIATSGGLSISGIFLTAGNGGAAARIHDSNNGASSTVNSILIAANAGETSSIVPKRPIRMDRGIFIIIEQGVGTGAELFITYD